MSIPTADKKLIMDFLTWMDTAVDTGVVEVDQYSGQWVTLPDAEVAQYVDTFLTLRAKGAAPDDDEPITMAELDAAVYALPDGSRYELTRTMNDLASTDKVAQPHRRHLRAAVEHVATMDPAERRDLSRPLMSQLRRKT